MNKKYSYTKLELFAFAALCLQLLYIIYLNLFHCSSYIDYDMAKLYRHAIEIVRNGSFLIPGWKYITTMELDCSLFLAIPFYLLTKNIYISFGIANVIFIFLYLYVIFDILKKFDIRFEYKCVAAFLFLIPYRLGMLEYLNMMFFNGGQYIIKAFVPLLAIDLFLYKDLKENRMPKNIGLPALYAFLLFLTTVSSGTYVFLNGILPVIFCYCLNIVLSGNIKNVTRQKIMLCVGSTFVFLAGYAVSLLLHISAAGDNTNFISLEHFLGNIGMSILGFLDIFFINESVRIISGAGVLLAIRIVFVAFILYLIVSNVKQMFQRSLLSDQQRYLIIPFLWTFGLICLISRSSGFLNPGRYFLICLVPIFLLASLWFSNIEKLPNTLLARCLQLTGGAFIILTAIICDINTQQSILRQWDEVKIVCQYAEALDVDTVLFLNNSDSAEVARLYDTERSYGNVQLENEAVTITNHDFYQMYDDRAAYGEQHLLAVSNSHIFDALPAYLTSSYVEVGTVRPGYTIYSSGPNKFDGISGFPVGSNTSIDFCYSTGYYYSGTMNAYGYLEAVGTGENVLISPLLEAPPETCSITLSYTTDDTPDKSIGQLLLLNESLEVIASSEINTAHHNAQLTTAQTGNCYLVVSLDEGERATLERITFERLL